ncbi:MAG TPA: hypothetical protein VMR18_03595 [Candidatus Saccharimonadales bacterium]|nr:hypothetical protein [Candidatus Saccharimonadales bacterium]
MADQTTITPRTPRIWQKKKPHITPTEESRQDMKDAIKGSNQVLLSATTTFTLFPDTLTLDRAKITVAKRTFYRIAEVTSMRIEDVLNVTAKVGPLFGSIKVVSRVMNNEEPNVIGLFRRDEAIRIKRIIQGYIIAQQRKIDCSSLPTNELIAMLDKLGEDDHPI